MTAYLMLLFLLVLGYFNKNITVAGAAGILLILKLVLPVKMLEYFGAHGMNWGIILLTAGMFAPIALGTITPRQIVDSFKTPVGIASIIIGSGVSVLGIWGVDYLKEDPTIVVAITVGTVAGVAFFKGLPIGPVIATGIVYGFVQLVRFIMQLF